MFCGGVVSVVTVTPTSVRGSVKFMNVASVNVIVTAFTGADHDTRVNARTRVETRTRFMSSSVVGRPPVGCRPNQFERLAFGVQQGETSTDFTGNTRTKNRSR